MADSKVTLKKITITKSVSHPPYNLGYSIGETAEVTPDMYELLLADGRGVAPVDKAPEKEKTEK